MKDEVRLHARDKKVQRMTKDGLVEDNLSTGGSNRISDREAEVSFQKDIEKMELRGRTLGQEMKSGKSKRYYRKRQKKSDRADAGKSSERVNKLESKAEKADEKYTRAKGKLPKKKKIKYQRLYDEKKNRTVHKLHFEETIKGNPSAVSNLASSGVAKAELLSSGVIHGKVHEDGDDNYAVGATHSLEATAEGSVRTVKHFQEKHEHHQYKKVNKLQQKSEDVHVKLQFEKAVQENPEIRNNPVKRMQQKRLIRKEYQQAQRAASRGQKTAGNAGKAFGNTVEKVKDKLVAVVKNNKALLATVAACILLVVMLSSALSSCAAIFTTGGGAVTTSTYLSTDDAIVNTNNAYSQLESDLQYEVDHIESTYPGYDEYRYTLDEIDHDPYALTSYLTAKYGNFKEADVAGYLQGLFDEQYTLTVTEEVEIRTRTETRTGTETVTEADGSTSTETYTYEVEVEYEYYILNVSLVNKGMDAVVTPLLNENQLKEYQIYQASSGNRAYLFGEVISGNVAGGGISYEIPPEALEDDDFRAMITEAEKYLGYPYVWGGSSPSTSFDCSGFVCWVINHSVGNVGRTTANGLLGCCTYVSPNDAKPGDLIFFEGTYNTSGASHVGIYVGNGMMIHCGNPIQYASIETNYWQSHFYCFGRIN